MGGQLRILQRLAIRFLNQSSSIAFSYRRRSALEYRLGDIR
jgi:hypothetical protein